METIERLTTDNVTVEHRSCLQSNDRLNFTNRMEVSLPSIV